ncbi:conserved hypothetical protein [uncultured Pleomorphomonas sp.]|uniref:Uncharacterized protein n=2 Tax=uncultured Pleomorphomonas sp. TaxID=442121 RepID=A0A212LIU4_9HYPH|nr:conserved hypothetical protein [uncultured Pleomorphomonas sp.]
MFMKADGRRVWLRTPLRLSYLAVSGHVHGLDDADLVRLRLGRRYSCIPGIASGGAFVVNEFDDEAKILLCVEPSLECAFILVLGEECRCSKKSPIDRIHRFLSGAVNDVEESCDLAFQLDSLSCDSSLPMN